jgi:hypothetical protein
MNETVGVILVIGVIVGVLVLKSLLGKGIDVAAKAANKNIIYKDEYKIERQLISEKLSFETTASIEEIMRQLTISVAPAPEIGVVQTSYYELMRDANTIAYTYQNKLFEQFAAAVEFEKAGDLTRGTFRFIRWNEKEGMLVGTDAMKQLRKKVWAGFEAADPSVKVVGIDTAANAG